MGGNCAGYCNGKEEMSGEQQHQFRQSFNRQDINNKQHNDFEQRYGKYSRLLDSPHEAVSEHMKFEKTEKEKHFLQFHIREQHSVKSFCFCFMCCDCSTYLSHKRTDIDWLCWLGNDIDYTYQGDMSKKQMGPLGENMNIRAEASDQVDAYGRVTKGSITMKNGATYTGQWLNNMRDGYGTQLWPDGSRYEG